MRGFDGKNKIKQKFLALGVALALFLLPFSGVTSPNQTLSIPKAQAASVSQLNNQKSDLLQKITIDGQQITAYKSQIPFIQQQIAQLDSQIASMKSSISATQGNINSTNNKIAELKAQIQDQQNKYDQQKASLGQLVADWYMQGGDPGLAMTLIGSNSLSDMITRGQYYASVKDQIQTTIAKINDIKNQLAAQKVDQDKQLSILNDLQSSQVTQQKSLQSSERSQSGLLTNTTNTVAQLQNDQATASAQVAQLDQQIQAAYRLLGGGGKITGPNIHGPTNMNIKYYSQNDSQWANKTLGDGGLSLDTDGCLITSMAMVATSFGLNYNPATLTDDSIFSDSYFQGFAANVGGLANYAPRESTDYGKIDSELQKGYPVIVGIYLSSAATHWIVLTGGSRGNYSWYDPYTKWSNPLDYNSYTFFAMRTFD